MVFSCNLFRFALSLIAGIFFATTAVLYVRIQTEFHANGFGRPFSLLPENAASANINKSAPSTSAATTVPPAPPRQNLRHAMFFGSSLPPREAETAWKSSRLAAGGEGGRFPLRGTATYSEQCGWTTARPVADGNCTLLIRPPPKAKEGVSCWIADIVDGYILARQSGCRLVLDYGAGPESVDVRKVLEPLTEDAVGRGADEEGMYNWIVPRDFACRLEDQCFLLHEFKAKYMSAGVNRTALAGPPQYRFAIMAKVRSLATCNLCMFEDSAPDLQRVYPTFRLETGYACVHSNLFRLAPTADEYEPRLFDALLPALHDDSSLVIAVYIRTGHTDVMVKREQQVQRGEVNATEPLEELDFTGQAGMMLKCVKSVEKRYLTGELSAGRDSGAFTGVVWMFLTDSVKLKKWVKSKYARPTGVRNIKRRVLVTGSRGLQTRPQRAPSQSDFATAVIDWLLIGESDVVASNKLTFGNTGGMRTARPIYDLGTKGGNKCERKIFVHSRPDAD